VGWCSWRQANTTSADGSGGRGRGGGGGGQRHARKVQCLESISEGCSSWREREGWWQVRGTFASSCVVLLPHAGPTCVGGAAPAGLLVAFPPAAAPPEPTAQHHGLVCMLGIGSQQVIGTGDGAFHKKYIPQPAVVSAWWRTVAWCAMPHWSKESQAKHCKLPVHWAVGSYHPCPTHYAPTWPPGPRARPRGPACPESPLAASLPGACCAAAPAAAAAARAPGRARRRRGCGLAPPPARTPCPAPARGQPIRDMRRQQVGHARIGFS